MKRIRSIEELSGPQTTRPYRIPSSRTVSRRAVRKGLRRAVHLALTKIRGKIGG